MDFGKLYCNIHPCQQITNFCNKNQCLIGLCANCICIHTQQHVDKGTTPEYQNIRQTYKKIQDTLRSQTELFEHDKQRLQNIKNKINQKRLKIRQTIDLAKQQVLSVLGGYFDEKQKKMVIEMESQEKKYGLHCMNRIDSLNSFISREASNLIFASQELTTNSFIQSLPRIRNHYLANSQRLHDEISNEMELNEKFNTNISFNKALMPQLTTIMEKAICLEFDGLIYNQQRNKQNYQRRPLSYNKAISRAYSCQTIDPLILSYIKDRNFQIKQKNENNNYIQQKQSNKYKLVNQIQKKYHLNQIQNYQNNNTKKQLQSINQKISISQKHFKNISESLPHHQPSHSVPYIQFTKYNHNQQSSISHNVSLQDKIQSSRDHSQVIDDRSIDHSQNSNINSNLVIFNPNYQINSPFLQKNMENATGGMSKKSKKSGLRIVLPSEIQDRMARTQNVQNYRSPSDRHLY